LESNFYLLHLNRLLDVEKAALTKYDASFTKPLKTFVSQKGANTFSGYLVV